MLKIGITGGIGTGKTTICRVFELLGIPVFYADVIAKNIMVTDPVLIDGVKSTFGTASYFSDGSLNNKHLAKLVFQDELELAKLNALVHPAVFRAFEVWEQGISPHVPYTLKEAALLFESGSYRLCDKNILVTAPLATRIARVIARDSVTKEQVLARISKQLGDDEKSKMADFFIQNTETESIILQVLNLHHQFLKIKTGV